MKEAEARVVKNFYTEDVSLREWNLILIIDKYNDDHLQWEILNGDNKGKDARDNEFFILSLLRKETQLLKITRIDNIKQTIH